MRCFGNLVAVLGNFGIYLAVLVPHGNVPPVGKRLERLRM